MNTTQTQMITARVPVDLVEAAKRLAQKDDRSLSNFFKLAIKDAVERAKERPPHQHSTAA